MTIHTAFQNVRSFQDFQDAYAANDPGIPGVGRNDLVRAYRIARRARDFVIGSSRVTFNYADLNTSQSSVIPVVSKLNRIFRFLGLLPMERSGTIRIVQNDFYTCVLDFTRIYADSPNLAEQWRDDAVFAGRGQDRVSTRHQVGHRLRSARLAYRRRRGGLIGVSALAAPTVEEWAMISLDFDPFAGVDMEDIQILMDDAQLAA